ncbi:hypothetical protein ADJ73_02945 [Arsenicicoccus sp. oral taxon 190]|nr:hypothetical protein ADJ73_02945 [Arsenicicoccus sp. oral taxon 190]
MWRRPAVLVTAALAAVAAVIVALVGHRDAAPSPAVPSTRVSAAASTAAGRIVDGRSVGLLADGRVIDGGVLTTALQQAARRAPATLLLPQGALRLRLDRPVTVPSGVTVRGAGSDLTTLAVQPPDTELGPLFLLTGDRPALADLSLARTGAAPAVLVGIGSSSAASLAQVRLDCARNRWSSACHGIQLVAAKGETIRGLRIDASAVQQADYALFQTSGGQGTVRDLVVSGSRFSDNHASDLELNAPAGVMQDVQILDNDFSSNRSRGELSGWGVGLAHVSGAIVSDNRFRGYSMSGVHVEDRSVDVVVRGNTFVDVGTRPLAYQSDVIVLSGSTRVRVEANTFRHTTPPGTTSTAVWVGHGGAGWPADVVVQDNLDVGGGGRPVVGDYGVERLLSKNNRSQG